MNHISDTKAEGLANRLRQWTACNGAMKAPVLFRARMRLLLQLGEVAEATQTLTEFQSAFLGFPTPLWVVMYQTIVHWLSADLGKVSS